MAPRRRADDLTPKDDAELDEWFATVSARVQAAHRRRERRDRAVAAFVVACALIFAWRIEVAQNRITAAAHLDRQRAFEQCQLVNENARALNGLIDIVILRVQTSQLSPKDKAQAVALYERSKQSLPVCTKP